MFFHYYTIKKKIDVSSEGPSLENIDFSLSFQVVREAIFFAYL